MQAYIAQYSELSSLEIPGKTLDVLHFAGCDFSCPYCNVPEYLDFKEEFIVDVRAIKEKIRQNRNGIDGVLFTGGEPCLQREALLEIVRFSKKLGLKNYLHTNGSKPECLKMALKGSLIDSIIFDIKAPFDPESFEKTTRSKTFFKTPQMILKDIESSLFAVKGNPVNIEFRTVITPSLVFKKEDILSVAERLEKFNAVWSLVKFNPERCNSKKLESLNPPSDAFLVTIKDVILQKYPHMNIEII